MDGRVIVSQRIFAVGVLAASIILCGADRLTAAITAALVNIDDFNTIQSVTGGPGGSAADTVNPNAVSNVLGGYQYLWAQGYSFPDVTGRIITERSFLSSGSQPGTVLFNAFGTFLVAKPFLEFGLPAGVIRYDGTANTGSAGDNSGGAPDSLGDIKVNRTGLYVGGQPRDLTGGGQNNALTIDSASVVGGFADILITVYTGPNGNNIFTDSFGVPTNSARLDFLFTDFNNGSTFATQADFASVGAITVQIFTSRPIDTATAETTVTLDPLTADFAPASVPEPASLLTWLLLTAMGTAAYHRRRQSAACGGGTACELGVDLRVVRL